MKISNVFFLVLVLSLVVAPARLWGQSSLSSPPPKPSLCVNGIIFEQEKPLAIINGDTYKKGDIVEGALILEISESAITAEFAGTTFTNALGEGCDPVKQITSVIGQTINQANRQLKTGKRSPADEKKLTAAVSQIFNLGELDQNAFGGSLMALIILMCVLVLLNYVYFALTLQMVAKKTATGSSWLAWVPLGNIILMCMVARRPVWWVPLMIVLTVTVIGVVPALVMIVIIFMDIAEARGKPKWLAILACLPGVNSLGSFFYWGYLAFSGGSKESVASSEGSDGTLPKDIRKDKAPPNRENTASEGNLDQAKGQNPDQDPPVYDG